MTLLPVISELSPTRAYSDEQWEGALALARLEALASPSLVPPPVVARVDEAPISREERFLADVSEPAATPGDGSIVTEDALARGDAAAARCEPPTAATPVPEKEVPPLRMPPLSPPRGGTNDMSNEPAAPLTREEAVERLRRWWKHAKEPTAPLTREEAVGFNDIDDTDTAPELRQPSQPSKQLREKAFETRISTTAATPIDPVAGPPCDMVSVGVIIDGDDDIAAEAAQPRGNPTSPDLSIVILDATPFLTSQRVGASSARHAQRGHAPPATADGDDGMVSIGVVVDGDNDRAAVAWVAAGGGGGGSGGGELPREVEIDDILVGCDGCFG